MSANDDEFFVPDEPVAELLAAYEAGEKGVTAPPEGAQRTTSQPSKLTHVTGWLACGVHSANRTIPGRSARFTTTARTFTVNPSHTPK